LQFIVKTGEFAKRRYREGLFYKDFLIILRTTKNQNYYMELFFDILKITLPAGIVFATAYFVLKTFLGNDLKKREVELKVENQKMITPVRLQAYERLILLIERTHPEQLITRVYSSTMNVERFQQALLTTVRAEFEHNMSQQIYVSEKTWLAIKNSKESVVQIINTMASNLKPDAPAIELSKGIVDALVTLNNSPTGAALKMIKMEVQTFFA